MRRAEYLSMVTRLRVGHWRDCGLISHGDRWFFSSPKPADRLSGPSCKTFAWVVSVGVQRPRTIAGNSSSLAEDNNEWCCNFTPLCVFMAVAGSLCQPSWLDMARRLTVEAHDVRRLRLEEIIYTPYGGSKFLWNICIDLQDCTVTLSRRLPCEKSNVETVGMSPK